MSSSGKGYVQCDSAKGLPVHSSLPDVLKLETVSLRSSCSADLNKFRGRAIRTALLSCHCHRGLLYFSDRNSRERLRQLNFMHKAHLPVAHFESEIHSMHLRGDEGHLLALSDLVHISKDHQNSQQKLFSAWFCLYQNSTITAVTRVFHKLPYWGKD